MNILTTLRNKIIGSKEEVLEFRSNDIFDVFNSTVSKLNVVNTEIKEELEKVNVQKVALATKEQKLIDTANKNNRLKLKIVEFLE
jgi:hypothetical protein